MARTIDDAVTQARAVLQDELEPYRYSTDDLVNYLNDSFPEMRRLRPDIFVGLYRTELPTYTADDMTEPFPLSDMWFTPSINFILYRAQMREEQGASYDRAQTFYALFEKQLRGWQ